MKIAVCSDLHLEFQDLDLQNTEGAEVLILSGDIMIAEDLHNHKHFEYNPYTPGALADLGRRQKTALRFRDFLKRCSERFPHVIYVAGNHEFYHGKWKASLQDLRDTCAQFSNVYFLERDVKVINDVTFIGATLWTDMNKGDPLTLHSTRDMMNDYRATVDDRLGYTKLKPATTVQRHRETREYIFMVADQNKDKTVVVVTHHTPSFQSCHEQYRGDYTMNGCYHSELSEPILDRPQIKLWTHGHTHHPWDYMIGETRVVCNPRGYVGYEQTGWDVSKVVEI